MPKRQYPPTRSNKKKTKVPETADDFIAIALEFEESGDRWRAGDIPRAGRFYLKACDAYNSALAKNPRSIDAAYNLARLQLCLATEEALLPPESQHGAQQLEVALASHRRCLDIEPMNEDSLFNTAQTCTALAEAYVDAAKGLVPAEEGRYLSEAAKLLQEAIGLFDEAMDIQEAEVNANKAVNTRDGMQDVDMGDEPEAVAPNEVKDEDEKMGKDDDDGGQWALVKEAVTVEDILDTALAELQTLVTLWGLCQYVEGHSDPLTFVRNTGNKLLDKISMLAAPSPDNLPEIALAKANYTVAAADAYFKAGRLSLKYYDTQVRESFTDGKDGLTVSGVAATLGHKAQAHIQFGTTVSESSTSDETAGKLVWSHYSAAAKDLAAAATLDTRKANLHCLRGDVEMWRSKVNTPLPEATRKTLLQNAGVYYRGALRVAQATNDSSEIAIEAAVKERMVAIEKEDPHPYPDATLANIAYNGDWRKVAEEAVQDGLFEQSTMAVLETMIH